MAAQDFRYDTKARRYRNAKGRFVNQATIKAAKNAIIASEVDRARALADRAVTGKIGTDVFVREMRALIKTTTTMQYLLGRGGREMMTRADRGRVGGLLRTQYAYLNRFAGAINERELTSRMGAQYRAELYMEATRSAYDKGLAAAWAINLPTYPGDGTACKANCKCSWQVSEVGKGKNREVRAYWRVNSSAPCETCNERRGRYNPYRVPRPETET